MVWFYSCTKTNFIKLMTVSFSRGVWGERDRGWVGEVVVFKREKKKGIIITYICNALSESVTI